MKETSSIKEILANSQLFQGIAEEGLDTLVAVSRRETYEAGDIILVEGSPAEYLYVLEKGKVALEMKISIGSSVSRRSTIGVLTTGAACGWSAAFGVHPLTMSVRCLEPTKVVAVEGVPLRRLLIQNPPIGALVVGRCVNIAFSRLQHTRQTLANILSIVSHDLKAPLAAVQSYNQVMLAGIAGETTEKQKFMLQRNSERIKGFLNLIDNLLDVSSVETSVMDMEPLSLPDVLRESVDNLRPLIEEKEIQLTIECPEHLPLTQGSKMRLQQVTNNLLDNAVKYTPAKGSISIRLLEDNSDIKMEISDTGTGIPAEELPRIFDDFYRSSTADGKGAGLGLAIARKIATSHKGRLWAESPCPETGRGSKFTLALPKNLPERTKRHESRD